MERRKHQLLAAILSAAAITAGCARQDAQPQYPDAPVGSYSAAQAAGHTPQGGQQVALSNYAPTASGNTVRRLPATDRNGRSAQQVTQPGQQPTMTMAISGTPGAINPALAGADSSIETNSSETASLPAEADPHGLLSGQFDFDQNMTALDVGAGEDPGLSAAQLAKLRVPVEIARRASGMLRDGNRLSERGATYAAEREFRNAMRLITQALDAQIGKQYHTKALSRAIRALEEADDFSMVSQDQPDYGVHLAGFVTGHTTPVLKRTDTNNLTPIVATKRYHEYAYQQLATAGGRDSLASEALFACGQIIAIQDAESPSALMGSPKCVPFLQAALTVNGANIRAANELGVVLARRGRLREAIHVFEFSARLAPTPLVIANLADAYSRAGNEDAAMRARQQGNQLASGMTTAAPSQSRVVWVDPVAFKQLGATPTDSEVQAVERLSDQLTASQTSASAEPTSPGSASTPRPRMAARPNMNWTW